jgi:nitrogen fixation NifU-like protein
MYSEKVMEHFTSPRNVGEIEDPDGVGEVGNPVCGDMMTFHVKVKDGMLADVKFRTFGCGAAIAVSSMVSEMAKGRTVEGALAITNRDVASELGGLPKHKMHCSNLGAEALHKAIEDYLGKSASKTEEKKPAGAADATDASGPRGKDGCRCPYCDADLPEDTSFCRPCGAEIAHCASCGEALPAGRELCESCAAEPVGAKEGGHG